MSFDIYIHIQALIHLREREEPLNTGYEYSYSLFIESSPSLKKGGALLVKKKHFYIHKAII